MDICRDLADGQLNGTYTPAELAAYQNALAHDPTIQGYCSPLVVVTTPPTTTVTTTVGTTTVPAETGSTTTTQTNGVGGVTTSQQSPPPPKAQVKGAQKVQTSPAPATPQQSAVSPLATTKSSGTLPFTGAELGVFAVVGAALLGGGLLLRLSARHRRSEP